MASQSESSAGSDGSIRPAARGGDSTPRRVLEDVLKQTAALNAAEHGIHPADLELLIDVARRLRGMEFRLDPVVIELVRVTLARQLKNAGQTEEQFKVIVDRVAKTLFENPESEARLRSLWVQLSAVE